MLNTKIAKIHFSYHLQEIPNGELMRNSAEQHSSATPDLTINIIR